MMLRIVCLFSAVARAVAWGSDSSSDTSMYGNSLSRDWLYEASSMSIQVEGCMYGFVEDGEDLGCLADSSEDGTTYWYQMANCRRPQVVYSVYASGGNNANCNSGNFKESFVTADGLQEFIYYSSLYDANSPFSVNNDDGNDDGYNGNGGNLPYCEQVNGNYVGLGCSDDGSFSLQYFSDYYCMQPTGKTYDKLRSLNNKLRSYKNCASISSGNNNGGEGEGGNGGNNFITAIVQNSHSCSSLDTGLCSDNSSMKTRRSYTSNRLARNRAWGSGTNHTWLTKLKYVAGGLLLLASFVMFTGILFTNRRRRRALMQRKYRQSKHRDGSSRRSKSRSKSKTRDSSRKSSRSKSKSRPSGDNEGGVFT